MTKISGYFRLFRIAESFETSGRMYIVLYFISELDTVAVPSCYVIYLVTASTIMLLGVHCSSQSWCSIHERTTMTFFKWQWFVCCHIVNLKSHYPILKVTVESPDEVLLCL